MNDKLIKAHSEALNLFQTKEDDSTKDYIKEFDKIAQKDTKQTKKHGLVEFTPISDFGTP